MNESISLNSVRRNVDEIIVDLLYGNNNLNSGFTSSSAITGSIVASDTNISYSSYSSLEEENRILKEKIKTLQKIIADYEY